MGNSASFTSILLEQDLDKKGLSNIDELDFTCNSQVIQDYYVVIKYSCYLKEEFSKTAIFNRLVLDANNENKNYHIGGNISLKNPFDNEYFVEQTIEGKINTVLQLWKNIKKDKRIDRIVEKTFSISKEPNFKEWALKYEIYESHNFSLDFFNELIKYEILQHNDNKTVFLTEDPRTGKQYVMKEILLINSKSERNAKTEYMMLKYIHSLKNIEVLGICHVPDIFYTIVNINLVYPIYNMDLYFLIETYTKQYKKFGLEREITIVYFYQLLCILKTLQIANVVHRDIKLENICVDRYGNLVLIDFEVSKKCNANDCSIVSNSLVGTMNYVAPEILSRCTYSQHSDLWAIGMIVCEMISIELPWDIPDSMDQLKLQALLSKPPKKPSMMDDDLWDILLKIFRPIERRINVDELMKDELFDSVRQNPFDSRDELQVIRNIIKDNGFCRQSGSNKINLFRRCVDMNKSPIIDGDRSLTK